MNETKYFSRSWAMLTRDHGWYKPLLVMAAAQLVPIAGYLGTKGYGLEWARLTAWGVDAAPKQKGVKVGKCIGSGWRGFVVDLGMCLLFGLVLGIITTFANMFPGVFGNLLSTLVSLATSFASIVFGVALMVAELRAAIYESIGAGYSFKNIYAMIKRDTKGFFKLVLIAFVSSLVVFAVMLLVMGIVGIMFAPALIAASMGSSSAQSLMLAVGASLVTVVPLVVIFGFVFSVAYNGISLVLINAVGLWMRQFNVEEWGRSEDPLPTQGYAAPQGQAPQNPYGASMRNDQPYGQPYDQSYGQPRQDSYAPYDQANTHVPQEVQPVEPDVRAPQAAEYPVATQVDEQTYRQPEYEETRVLPQQDVSVAQEIADQEYVDPTVIFGAADDEDADVPTAEEAEDAPTSAPVVETETLVIPMSEPEADPDPAPIAEPEAKTILESAADEEVVADARDDQDEIDELYEDFLTIVKESDKTDD